MKYWLYPEWRLLWVQFPHFHKQRKTWRIFRDVSHRGFSLIYNMNPHQIQTINSYWLKTEFLKTIYTNSVENEIPLEWSLLKKMFSSFDIDIIIQRWLQLFEEWKQLHAWMLYSGVPFRLLPTPSGLPQGSHSAK